jgi:hypothetical protein
MMTAKRKYQLKTFWLVMLGAMAKNIPMEVKSQANQTLVGVWVSDFEG